MNPTERVEVRKIYVGRASLFGLLYGLIMGIIIGIFLFVGILLGSDGVSIFGVAVKASVGMGFLLLIGSVIFYSVIGCIACAVWAIVYNLIAGIGGMMHLGLAEHVVQ